MVVMDVYTRRIVGIAVIAGPLDGPTICRMFGRIVSRAGVTPKAIKWQRHCRGLYELPITA
jgi:hypothetical protein